MSTVHRSGASGPPTSSGAADADADDSKHVRHDRIVWAVWGLIAIALVVIGLASLPDHGALRNREFSVDVQPKALGDLGHTKLVMSMSKMTSTSTDYRLTVWGETERQPPLHPLLRPQVPLSVTLGFQPDVSASCGSVRGCTSTTSGKGNKLLFTLGKRVTFTVSSSRFTFAENGEDAEGWLPNTTCTDFDCPDNSGLIVSVRYAMPDVTDYQWTSGPPPGIQQGLGQGIWEQYAGQLHNPVLVSGTNPDATQHDAFRLFLSGVLAGVGCALAAGVIVEMVRSFLARRRRVPEAPHPAA
jgi:hypothetical protein